MDYKTAGVDIDAGVDLVKRIQALCPDIGGFGGLYPLGNHYLVAGTDGVGTKLKLAFSLNKHDTIGIDLVAMCVNDIITTGAKPLFFLDYFATSKLDVNQAEMVIKGIIDGCREAGCVLLGGETAEMPDFYKSGEYDISGFAVGIVNKEDLINGESIDVGDILVGIPSNGLHSNGFSLARKILTPDIEMLTPTRIYVQKLDEIKKHFLIKGIAHITGGGITENIPRILPTAMVPKIDTNSWEIPKIFHNIQKTGKISDEEMFRTFNMGIGMVLAMNSDDAHDLCEKDQECIQIGEVVWK